MLGAWSAAHSSLPLAVVAQPTGFTRAQASTHTSDQVRPCARKDHRLDLRTTRRLNRSRRITPLPEHLRAARETLRHVDADEGHQSHAALFHTSLLHLDFHRHLPHATLYRSPHRITPVSSSLNISQPALLQFETLPLQETKISETNLLPYR